jgi:hypothetical protein
VWCVWVADGVMMIGCPEWDGYALYSLQTIWMGVCQLYGCFGCLNYLGAKTAGLLGSSTVIVNDE